MPRWVLSCSLVTWNRSPIGTRRASRLVSRRNDSCVFHHQDDGALRSTGPMFETLGHHESLPRSHSDGTIWQIDQELAIQDEEERVVVVVFMPGVFPLHHTQAHD